MSTPSSPGPATPVPNLHSNILAGACLALAVLLPVAVLAWLTQPWPGAVQAAMQAIVPAGYQGQGGSARWAVVAALATMPALMMSLALLRARACLRAFGRGNYFGREPVLALRGFAGWVFAAGVAGLLVPTLATLVLTLGGSGRASLVVSVGSQPLILMLFSALVWQIAAVMARAVALAEENAQFV